MELKLVEKTPLPPEAMDLVAMLKFVRESQRIDKVLGLQERLLAHADASGKIRRALETIKETYPEAVEFHQTMQRGLNAERAKVSRLEAEIDQLMNPVRIA